MDLEIARSAMRSAEARVSRYDWETLAGDLNAHGCAVLEKLLSPEECRDIAALYPQEAHFRSHVHMARHGFGKGEYRYFKYPLPELLGDLRTALYPRLAAIANDWNARMGATRRYPDRHSAFLQAVCRGHACSVVGWRHRCAPILRASIAAGCGRGKSRPT